MKTKQLEAAAAIIANFKAAIERSGMPNEVCRDKSPNAVFVDVRLMKQLADLPLDEVKS